MSCKSGIQPLQLGFSNVTLTSNGNANANGIALQFGTPGQILALTPSVLFNNTILENRARCGSNANDSCIQSIGGGYNPDTSSTYRAATSDSWNGSAEAEADLLINVPSTYFNDVLSISNNNTLAGFPLLLEPTSAISYSALGIGNNSTFIARLLEAGLSPSNSWSFFAGVYSSARAGALIIGGYADRFYQGDLHTKNVTDSCETCFRVSSMKYHQDGIATDLLPDTASGAFTAVIDAYYPVILFADDMLYKFGNATNGTYAPELGLFSYDPNNIPTGSITVTLYNGLTTVIPNKALFDPPAYDNGLLSGFRTGAAANTTYSTISSAKYWTNNSTSYEGVALMGMPYAAMLYLIRDHERGTLSIANANQDAVINGDITPICPVNEDGSGGGSSHTGAIAGGVVGGVVGLALIIFLAWFLWRRKHKKAAGVQPETKEVESNGSAKPTVVSKSELPTDSAAKSGKASFEKSANSTQELSGEDARVEAPTHDMTPPTELPAQGKVVRAELPA